MWRSLFAFAGRMVPERCVICGKVLAPGGCADPPVCAGSCRQITPPDGVLCPVCGVPLSHAVGPCSRCTRSGYAFEFHRSLSLYRGRVRDLIIEMKFHRRRRVVLCFVEPISNLVAGIEADAIVPVPPSRSGRRRRGFDHVKNIARRVSRERNIQFLPLLRRGRAPVQKTLNFTARLANMGAAIRVCAVLPGSARRVILVDDVFTTGATMSACAAALKQRGALEVFAVSLAMEP